MKRMQIDMPKKLKNLMEAEKWDKHRLAKKAGVTYKTVWSWLSGKSKPRYEHLARIAMASSQAASYLLTAEFEPVQREVELPVGKKLVDEAILIKAIETAAHLHKTLESL